jgi:four helix bundle protein
MRRSASSIPSNIAEGCGRDGKAELVRFLHIAAGSASELQDQVLLARDLSFMNDSTSSAMLNHIIEVKRMITGLVSTVNTAQNRTRTTDDRRLTTDD